MIPFDRAPMTSYRHFIATMGLARTVSEINSDFSRKSQIFPTPVYFVPLPKLLPLELGIGAGIQETRMMGLLGGERSFTISSAVWIQYTNVTERQTLGDSKDRAYT